MSISNNTIIGIAGTFASGKDTLAGILVDQYGYAHAHTSDMVREIAQAKYGSVERPVLQRTAQEYRERYGAGYFVERGLKQSSRPVVVTGLRSIGEAKAIIAAGGHLVYVDAPVEVRYERMKSRARDQETTISLDEFWAREAKELYGGPKDSDFNIAGIRELSETVLINEHDKQAFLAAAVLALGLEL